MKIGNFAGLTPDQKLVSVRIFCRLLLEELAGERELGVELHYRDIEHVRDGTNRDNTRDLASAFAEALDAFAVAEAPEAELCAEIVRNMGVRELTPGAILANQLMSSLDQLRCHMRDDGELGDLA